MNKVKKLIFLVMVVLLLLSTQVLANTINYHENGNISSVVTDEGTANFYETGLLSSLITNNLTLKLYPNSYLSSIICAEGIAFYNEDGTLSSCTGDLEGILNFAKHETSHYGLVVHNYIYSIGLDLTGITSPKMIFDNLDKVFDTMISNAISTTNNSLGANINSSDISVNINDSDTQNNLNNNDNTPTVEEIVDYDENIGYEIGTEYDELEQTDNVMKYVLLGLAFFVAFLVLFFGIILIKKSKNQIKVKE